MQSHHLIAKEREPLWITVFNFSPPSKLNITAQSRDKQTTGGNLLVFSNAQPSQFVFEVVRLFHTCTNAKGILCL